MLSLHSLSAVKEKEENITIMISISKTTQVKKIKVFLTWALTSESKIRLSQIP